MGTVVPASERWGDVRASAAAGPRYGYFAADANEYRITDPRTPRPWVNVIANPRFGLTVSQAGSGFTWIDNSQLAVISRWEQDFARDSTGKFMYIRDVDADALWSLAPAPLWPAYSAYECRHGLGYTTFVTEAEGIHVEWTLFVHTDDPIEFWRIELTNLSERTRRLELCAYLEWNCGLAPAPRREFQKLFIETELDRKRRAIVARSHMWDVASERWGHWNTAFPYTCAVASTEPILSAQADKAEFIGRNGDLRCPAALRHDVWPLRTGRHEDPIAALRCAVELGPRQRRFAGFVIAAAERREALDRLLEESSLTGPRAAFEFDTILEAVRARWRERFATHRVQTPEPTLDHLINDWARYQAISARLWGRCGYYQQSGAFGFRDQLQDSQVWLTIAPQCCREQINLHARHQFVDGSVYHWWHPLSEQGHVTRMTDDLLWLAFVTASYVRETAKFDMLADRSPFIDDEQPRPLIDHVLRAFRRVFARTSPRGLPYIGAGDWNDGLSACGLLERGESIWLGHFLVGLLSDWAEILKRMPSELLGVHEALGGASPVDLAAEFTRRRAALITAINEHGWDGAWYIRGTLDDGSAFGAASNRAGRIFLNAQTWAVLNDIAPPDRAARCMQSVREHLITDAGPLLLAPAYDTPDQRIGYITRYAPGMRENGGVYTHAATWAIAAACRMRDHELVGRLLTAINPALKDVERYRAEPYVLPGNVDGPDSPYSGRAGWTWYTGSAQWLHRVVTQHVLGVRPDWDGLRIDPCLPTGWSSASMSRPWRGSSYAIRIDRVTDLRPGAEAEIALDGELLRTNLLPPPTSPGSQHTIRVRCR